ncbi:MAG: hypothetical protein H6747_15160 [Deltaproteobacteria bacterium]|nr:hypothetical protein [Deltaproteobacteria bacterium]
MFDRFVFGRRRTLAPSATLAAPMVAATLLLAPLLAPQPAQARSKSGPTALAMAHFDAGPREIGVIAQAQADGEGAIVVRVLRTDVPVCHLLVLDAAPKRATAVKSAARLDVCAVYDKDAKRARLDHVPLTSRHGAWRVFTESKRMDAMAKGVETRQLWALYSDRSGSVENVFRRVSTSFQSKANRAVNLAERCEPPSFSVSDTPSSLSIDCDTEAMLGDSLKKKRSTFRYTWSGSRFDLQ